MLIYFVTTLSLVVISITCRLCGFDTWTCSAPYFRSYGPKLECYKGNRQVNFRFDRTYRSEVRDRYRITDGQIDETVARR